eukprot:COSAG02_NODE_9545_length_2183_cov_95.181862_2_plen_71_part_01
MRGAVKMGNQPSSGGASPQSQPPQEFEIKVRRLLAAPACMASHMVPPVWVGWMMQLRSICVDPLTCAAAEC